MENSKEVRKVKKLGVILFVGMSIMVSTLPAKAVEWDVDFYGISYHLNPDEANKNAPRDLHIGEKGQTIFNPGIGLGVDFRNGVRDNGWYGFSIQAKAGYLRDCNDEPLYYGGAGIRYRHIFKDRVAFDIDLLGLGIYAKDWETGDFETTFTPYASIGIGYVFNAFGGDKILKLNVAYVPDNDTISATSGTDLLFFSATLGF